MNEERLYAEWCRAVMLRELIYGKAISLEFPELTEPPGLDDSDLWGEFPSLIGTLRQSLWIQTWRLIEVMHDGKEKARRKDFPKLRSWRNNYGAHAGPSPKNPNPPRPDVEGMKDETLRAISQAHELLEKLYDSTLVDHVVGSDLSKALFYANFIASHRKEFSEWVRKTQDAERMAERHGHQ